MTEETDRLQQLDLNGGDAVNGQEDEEEEVEGKGSAGETKSKKKRRRKKPSAAAANGDTNGAQTASESGSSVPAVPVAAKAGGKGAKGRKQTTPPSIPIKDLFANKELPVGEILEHPVVDTCVSLLRPPVLADRVD